VKEVPHERKSLSRREFAAVSAAASATILIGVTPGAAQKMKKTFTILHTNDLHSNLIGLSPASDYSPFTPNDDRTRGGFARLATLIAQRREARKNQGPVLVLDGGDYGMGTAFAGVIRETGAELQLLFQMGYDATTFGDHEFDFGPDGTAQAIAVASKAGRVPAVVASNSHFTGNDPTLAGLQIAARCQEPGRSTPHIEGRGTRRPASQHGPPAAPAGHSGQDQC
jgi:5'-nucleotidase